MSYFGWVVGMSLAAQLYPSPNETGYATLSKLRYSRMRNTRLPQFENRVSFWDGYS